MRELDDVVNIEFIKENQHQEHEGLRQELTKDGHHNVSFGLFHPLLASSELQFHT